MRTPKHFDSKRFGEYIYECAIRDRETYLEAITPEFGDPDEDTLKIMEETVAEIEAMQHRAGLAPERG